MPSDRHGPTRFRTYRDVHENRTEDFVRAGDFVQRHTLRYVGIPGHIIIVGQVACLGNIVLTVEKYLEVLDGRVSGPEVLDGDDDAEVQTIIYAYNASVRGHGNLLRYDNTHRWRGHADDHHRHRMDWRNNSRELPGSPEWVGYDRWPHLGDFMQEARDWYWEHRDELPDRDGVPDIEECVPRLGVPFPFAD